jgi:two-component system chemotaxis response regulator CheY
MSQTILIIDDAASIRMMVRTALANAGYQVLEAEDGQKGLDILQTQTVDLIFTDQNMPNMDGLTFVSHIRQRPGHEKTPILVLTTESSDDIKTRGKLAGATGWLVKLFNPVQLMTLVKKILG